VYSEEWKKLSKPSDLERRPGEIKVNDLAIAQNEEAANFNRYRYAKRLSVGQRQSIYNEPQSGSGQCSEDDGVGPTRWYPDNIDV